MPVGDTPTLGPTFCRIYAHRRHSCFGVIMQSFPVIGGPVDLRCMISGDLERVVGGSQQRPPSRRIRPGAASACRGGVLAGRANRRTPGALSPVPQSGERGPGSPVIGDTSLETYIRRTLDSLVEIREAVERRGFPARLGQYYSSKLGLRRQEALRIWLGDYPKVAEERKAAGVGPAFCGAALFE